MTLKERIARAIWLQYARGLKDADWNAVDPHYKETIWMPMAQAALEAMLDGPSDMMGFALTETIRPYEAGTHSARELWCIMVKAAIAER